MFQKVKFSKPTGNPFYATLRTRVDLYFRERSLSSNADWRMWTKSLFFILIFALLYTMILIDVLPPWGMLLAAIGLGMFSAFLGFNVCHDAIHGSLSRNKQVNGLFAFIFNLVGASPYVWSITHNIVHHTYTNIPGHDEDIEVAPGLIRISDGDEIRACQRFQHWYAFPLYSLASLSWVFRKDYKKFFQQRIGAEINRHPSAEYYKLFLLKLLYYVLFIVLPLLLIDISWWQFMIGFLVLHLAQGLTMGLVFQLAHVVEGTVFPSPNNEGRMEEAWAEHQMRTTANFATGSRLAAFFLGGLNRQIEHHLFPKVCHIHYGAIGNIVRLTASEFGLPYIENRSFSAALKSHFLTLRRFAREARAIE